VDRKPFPQRDPLALVSSRRAPVFNAFYPTLNYMIVRSDTVRLFAGPLRLRSRSSFRFRPGPFFMLRRPNCLWSPKVIIYLFVRPMPRGRSFHLHRTWIFLRVPGSTCSRLHVGSTSPHFPPFLSYQTFRGLISFLSKALTVLPCPSPFFSLWLCAPSCFSCGSHLGLCIRIFAVFPVPALALMRGAPFFCVRFQISIQLPMAFFRCPRNLFHRPLPCFPHRTTLLRGPPLPVPHDDTARLHRLNSFTIVTPQLRRCRLLGLRLP